MGDGKPCFSQFVLKPPTCRFGGTLEFELYPASADGHVGRIIQFHKDISPERKEADT
jgi:hypothetical protein